MSDIDDRIAIRSFDQKGDGAISFRYKDFYILLSVKRVSNKAESNLLVKKYGLDKPASKHVIKSFGFRIVVDDEKVEIFSYSKHPMTVGDARWLYNVQRSSVNATFVCTIGLRVSYADKPTKVDFLTKQKIDAALAAYRYGIEQCEFQLREELMRIYENSSHNLKEELISEAKSRIELEAASRPAANTVNSQNKPTAKHIVRFKTRS